MAADPAILFNSRTPFSSMPCSAIIALMMSESVSHERSYLPRVNKYVWLLMQPLCTTAVSPSHIG